MTTHTTSYAERTRAGRLARRAKTLKRGCHLIDARARHAEVGDGFAVPFAHEVEGLRAGDYCKIGVEGGDGGERFWTYIQGRDRGGRIVALVSNHMVCTDTHGLKLGDVIRYEDRHVLDVQGADEGGTVKADADVATIVANARGVCPCCNGLVRRGGLH